MSQYDFLKNFHFAAVHAERLEARPAVVIEHLRKQPRTPAETRRACAPPSF